MQLQEQKRKLGYLLENMPYFNKKVMQEHIIAFIQAQEFRIRQGLMRNSKGDVYSFVQVVGYIFINNHFSQCRLGFPHNYPDSAPQIYIVFDEDNYEMPNKANLINKKIIQITKNQAQQTLIYVYFQLVSTFWKGDKRNIIGLMGEISKYLNNPPIFQKKKNELQYKNANLFKTKGLGNSKNADKFMGQVQDQVIGIQLFQNQTETAQKDTTLSLSKLDFFNRNLPILLNNMEKYQKDIESKTTQINKIKTQLSSLEKMNQFLLKDEVQRQKIKVLARKQAVKESELKLKHFLSTNLSEHTCNLVDYKSTIKSVYQNMFQAQMKFLLSCDKE